MPFQFAAGDEASVQYAIFQPDGFTRWTGQAALIHVELWRSTPGGAARVLLYRRPVGEAPNPNVVPVAVTELTLGDPPAGVGEYEFKFTPPDADRTYTLVWRHAGSGADVIEDFQTWSADLGDIDAAIAGLAVQVDVLVEFLGVERVVEDEAWAPTIRFRRKSTMALFDPASVTIVEVVGADLATIEDFEGAGIVHPALGTYTVVPAPLANAGLHYLRVRFMLDGVAGALLDVVDFYVVAVEVVPAAGGAGTSTIERIYTCPTFLEQEGFDLAALDPEVVWTLIKQASATIDSLTNQWFNGERAGWEFDGRGREVIAHPGDLPIHGVEQVMVVGTRTNYHTEAYPSPRRWYDTATVIDLNLIGTADAVIEAAAYVVNPRNITRVRGRFPGGEKNVRVTCVLGWIDYRTHATTSTEALSGAMSSLTVTDVSGFRTRDVVDVVGELDAVRVIVTRVDRAALRIFFDAPLFLAANIPAGAAVQTFGQTPRDVERLAAFVFGKLRRAVEANAAGEAPLDPARLRSETTDGYSYTLFGTTGKSTITGDVMMDSILDRYSRRGSVRFSTGGI